MFKIILILLVLLIIIYCKSKYNETFYNIVLKGPSHFEYSDMEINSIDKGGKTDFNLIFKFNSEFAKALKKSNTLLNNNTNNINLTWKVSDGNRNSWKKIEIKPTELNNQHIIKNIKNDGTKKFLNNILINLKHKTNPNIFVDYTIDFKMDNLFYQNFNSYLNDNTNKILQENANKDLKIKRNKTKYKFDDLSETIPIINDELLLKLAKNKCSEYTLSKDKLKKYYIDKTNIKTSGCVQDIDSILRERRTKCNEGEKMISEGDKYSDIKCGICGCPDNYSGTDVKCSGTKDDLKSNNYKGIKGCKENIICTKTSKTDKDELKDCVKKDCIYFDKPTDYGDKTKNNICKSCTKKCPTGSYKIQDCITGTNTDLICKPHRLCDIDTMITIRNGTETKNTICECIEGYKWPIDKITRIENREADKCVPIKGKCYTNPCHKNALCYDNFNSDGTFNNFICKCDRNKGYIETDKLGVGKEGCVLLPNTHTHITDINNISEEAKNILKKDNKLDIKPFSIKKHIDDEFHQNLNHNHIHKSLTYTPGPSS